MIVHYYMAPYGEEKLLDVTKVHDEDADYFVQNKIKVSMEELGGQIIVYGCPYADSSEESEVIVISEGRSCQETMRELAEICKATFTS